MFPSPALQSYAVKYKYVLHKQLFMHCVKKNNLLLARLPGISAIQVKIIDIIASRLLLIFPEISGKFTTLDVAHREHLLNNIGN